MGMSMPMIRNLFKYNDRERDEEEEMTAEQFSNLIGGSAPSPGS